MKLLDQYSCIDVCRKDLPAAIEERLLIEAYRELPRNLQLDILGLMLYYLEVPGALPESSGTPRRALTIVKQDDICPAGRIAEITNKRHMKP